MTRLPHPEPEVHRLSWMTGAHFRWGAVSRLDPGSSRLRLMILPPRTSPWRRRCASTAAVPVCGWGALLAGVGSSAAGLTAAVAAALAVGLFVLGVTVVNVAAASIRRGCVELVALDPRHRASDPNSKRFREPTAVLSELVAADTAFREGRISEQRYDEAWADAYGRAVRFVGSRRS